MKPPSKTPVPERPPSPMQLAKAAARRAGDDAALARLNAGADPASVTIAAKSFDRAKLAEKVDAIMTAPRTVKAKRKGFAKPAPKRKPRK